MTIGQLNCHYDDDCCPKREGKTMTRTKWADGAWRNEDGRPVCVHCEMILDGHYTICIHCKTHLSRSQMDAAIKWDEWNKERFERASAEPDEAKRRAILKEPYPAQTQP